MNRIDVSRETMARLEVYAGCVAKWNTTINLVSPGDMSELWTRHIAQGIAVGKLLADHPGPVSDLGSGAGIPGLVAAITTNRAITLVEADRRKGAFLLEAGRLTGAPIQVKACRVQDAGLQGQAVVSARALAPLPALLTAAITMLRPGGVCLFVKGALMDEEVEAARSLFSFSMQVHRATATILAVHDLRKH